MRVVSRLSVCSLLVSVLGGLSSAQAASSDAFRSGFFFRAPKDVQVVTPVLQYQSSQVKYSDAAAGTTKITGIYQSGVNYEYGLMEDLSLGLNLSYTNLDVDTRGTKTTQSGFDDIIIFAKGKYSMDFGHLRYGAKIALGLEKSKIKASGDTNTSTGNVIFTPFVGLDAHLGSEAGTVGVKVSYDLLKTDEKVTVPGGADETITKGNLLQTSLFYEHQLADHLVGGALVYNWFAEQDVKVTDQPTTTQASWSTMGVAIYDQIALNDYTALVPQVSYAWDANSKYQGDKATLQAWNFQVAAHFLF